MFVAVLSLFAMPMLASAEERGTSGHDYTYRCPCNLSAVNVLVRGYYVNFDVFTGGYADWSPAGVGVTKISFSTVISDTIVWAEFVGQCKNCGRILTVTCWISPYAFPNRFGQSGSWSW